MDYYTWVLKEKSKRMERQKVEGAKPHGGRLSAPALAEPGL